MLHRLQLLSLKRWGSTWGRIVSTQEKTTRNSTQNNASLSELSKINSRINDHYTQLFVHGWKTRGGFRAYLETLRSRPGDFTWDFGGGSQLRPEPYISDMSEMTGCPGVSDDLHGVLSVKDSLCMKIAVLVFNRKRLDLWEKGRCMHGALYAYALIAIYPHVCVPAANHSAGQRTDYDQVSVTSRWLSKL